MKKKLGINFGGHSDAGVKASNQDAFTATIPSKHSARKYKGAAACIADGVSCSSNAQFASQTAATNFISDYFNTPDFWTVEQSASKVISSINSWLYQQGQSSSETRSDSYVTTFSAVIIKSHTAHILHIGDSRVYLLRDQKLELLTRDHCYNRGTESILSRALGIEPKLELDYKSLQIQLGDRFILTTDGVHESLNEKELIQLACNTDRDLEATAQAITEFALKQGSKDNNSCLLAEVCSLPIKRLEEVQHNLEALVIPPALEVGNTIDSFEIIRTLHSGTRSHVYLAKDIETDEMRVLKMPSTNFADDTQYLELFAREQWIGRKLSHSRIMKIYSPLLSSKFLYHCCEYIPGRTLRQWMRDNPEPSLTTVREILEGIVQTIRVLHRNRMVHRDLKPENFMIDDSDSIHLIDFGTMKIAGIDEIDQTQASTMPLGDLSYIAPETLVHSASDARSDLFSIAAIVYEMLSGQLPFKPLASSDDIPNNFERWRYKPLNSLKNPVSGIPTWVNSVLQKALSANPDNRFQAMSEFQHELNSPSTEILKSIDQKPLIARYPIGFWQGVSIILFGVIIVQWWFLSR